MPEALPQPFVELIPAPVTVVHHYASVAHVAAADACAAMAGALLGGDGLKGARTLHAGAGFGADARTALLWGAVDALGIEASPVQVAFDRTIREAPDRDLAATITGDEVSRRLYPEQTIRAAAQSLLTERAHVRRLPWAPSPNAARVVQGDLLRDDLLKIAGGEPRDSLIGNIMLHLLLVGGDPLSVCLDRFAPLIRPGGVMIFSLPYHLIEPATRGEDAAFRERAAQETRFYKGMIGNLLGRLKGPAPVNVLDTASSKLAPIAVSDREAAGGSRSFEFVQATTRYFGVAHGGLLDGLRGAALYEICFRTRLPAATLAGPLADAFAETARDLGADAVNETTGTFLRFYSFRRRSP